MMMLTYIILIIKKERRFHREAVSGSSDGWESRDAQPDTLYDVEASPPLSYFLFCFWVFFPSLLF